jgi:outer membrane protein TolC
MVRRLSVLLCLVLAAGPRVLLAQADSIEGRITLDEAVRRAVLVSPGMSGAMADVRTAEAARRSATGAFIPSLSLNSGALRTNQSATGPITQPAQTNWSSGVTAGLELFDGGRRFAARRSAAALIDAADAGLIQQRYAVRLAVKQAFYEVLRADQLIAVAEARIGQAQRSREIAASRHAAGTTTRSDELRADLELSSAREALLSAREDRLTATLNLGRLVGANGPMAAIADAMALGPSPLGYERAQLEAMAVEQAPSVIAAHERARSNAAVEKEAWASYFPSIKAAAGYNVTNDVVVPGAPRDGWQLQVGLSYPLFDGFQREERIDRASAATSVADAQAQDAGRLARAEAGRLTGAVALAEERIGLAGTAVTAAQEDLRVIEARYRVGASAILDLITSQVNLVEAETRLVTARFDYLVARAGLEALIGRDLPAGGN